MKKLKPSDPYLNIKKTNKKHDWTYSAINVDIDTGEIITYNEAKLNYKKHETRKDIDTIRRHISYTNGYRKNSQSRMFD